MEIVMLAWATQLARRGECEKRQREARASQQLVQSWGFTGLWILD